VTLAPGDNCLQLTDVTLASGDDGLKLTYVTLVSKDEILPVNLLELKQLKRPAASSEVILQRRNETKN